MLIFNLKNKIKISNKNVIANVTRPQIYIKIKVSTKHSSI